MGKTLQAELVSVGTELLRGEITDTNATFLASQLPLLGIELRRITTAGDNLPELCQILRQAYEKSDIVIVTGGLGPTQDDLTREAVGELLGETLTVDPGLEANLRSFFSRFGREMPPHNIKQAMLIPSSVSLPNPRGTAPGWWVNKNGKIIVLLPGPPREMNFMWQNEVLPRIKQNFPVKAILSRTIKTYFIQEAKVAELAHQFFKTDNPTLGIYAKPDGIQIRFLATGDDASRLLDDSEKQLTEKLAPFVWGKDDETLDGLISRLLIKHGLTLATSEEFSGGLLAGILANSTNSEQFYLGGLVKKTKNKENVIDASNGEIAAKNILQEFGAKIGLNISGINTDGFVFISITDAHGTKSWQQQYAPGRPDNRERAAMAALFRLRERLIENKLND